MGEGLRESIVPHFKAKCRPGSKGTEEDKAAAVEVLLRGDVPQDYADPLFLAESYMSKLPADETAAFAQITFQFPSFLARQSLIRPSLILVLSLLVVESGTAACR